MSRRTFTDRERIGEATRQYLAALCAHRDAKHLLELGFAAATAKARAVLSVECDDALPEAMQLVAAKEAADIIDLYDKDPTAYPDGRTADMALAASTANVRARYARGRCHFCNGPALACARRHAHGRSCA
jgi:hypothetical protein